MHTTDDTLSAHCVHVDSYCVYVYPTSVHNAGRWGFVCVGGGAGWRSPYTVPIHMRRAVLRDMPEVIRAVVISQGAAMRPAQHARSTPGGGTRLHPAGTSVLSMSAAAIPEAPRWVHPSSHCWDQCRPTLSGATTPKSPEAPQQGPVYSLFGAAIPEAL